ncbi:hypothetical protein R6Q59_000106 [Mikania micrantha]
MVEIRNQVFDEEKNKVMIKVVCCDPEKMRDKLCCKGGKAIQSIEILQPPPPPTVPKDPPKIPQPVTIPNPEPKPSPPKIDPDPPKTPQPQVKPQPIKPPGPPKPKPQPEPQPPVSVCCQECYEGRVGGPCHYWYAWPPPGPCYYYGYHYVGNRPPCYVRCDCFSEENPQGCSVM